MLADVAEERTTVRASRADVVDALRVDRWHAAASRDGTCANAAPLVCGRRVAVSSPSFGDGTCLAAPCPKKLRGTLQPLRGGFLDQRLEERAGLRLLPGATGRPGRSGASDLRAPPPFRPARARLRAGPAELAVALMVVRLHVVCGRRGSTASRVPAAPRRRARRRRPPSPCARSCRRGPARAARGRRRARRSAPASPRQIASTGTSRSSAARMQGELEVVPLAHHTVRLGMRRLAVQLRVEVGAAREDQPVDGIERLVVPARPAERAAARRPHAATART